MPIGCLEYSMLHNFHMSKVLYEYLKWIASNIQKEGEFLCNANNPKHVEVLLKN